MVSEADPYLWASLASLFFGLALGQGAKSLLRGRESPAARTSRKPRRIARATTFLALSILAVAGLLVFTKAVSANALDTALIAWAASIAVLAALVGLRPLACGAPIALLSAAVLALIGLVTEGWLPLGPGSGATFSPTTGLGPTAGLAAATSVDSATGPAVEIARLLPYEVGSDYSRGQLTLTSRRDASSSLPQETSLASSSVGLCAESLKLRDPLGFLAKLFVPTVYSASVESGPRLILYRVVGLVAPGGLLQGIPAPPRLAILERLAPLPADIGFDPGGKAAAESALLGLAERRRITSPSVALVALQPVHFAMTADASSLVVR